MTRPPARLATISSSGALFCAAAGVNRETAAKNTTSADNRRRFLPRFLFTSLSYVGFKFTGTKIIWRQLQRLLWLDQAFCPGLLDRDRLHRERQRQSCACSLCPPGDWHREEPNLRSCRSRRFPNRGLGQGNAPRPA